MKNPRPIQILKDQKGSLAVDFIFSFTLACLLSMMILAITTTFTVVEITQYVAFSGARAMAGADATINDQKTRGTSKINSLLTNPVLRPLLTGNNWFKINLKDIKTGGLSNLGGDGDDYTSEYGGSPKIFQPGQFIPQTGLRLNFEAKLLNFKVGFLGSTNNNDGNGYNALVTGFVIREPSQAECMSLMNQQQMIKAVRDLDSGRYGASDISGSPGNASLPLEDNGC